MVLGVQADFLGNLPAGATTPATIFQINEPVAFTTTRPSVQPTLADSNCFAYAQRTALQQNTRDPAGPAGIESYTYDERMPSDTPDTNLDYIAIIATSDFFVSGTESAGTTGSLEVAYKIYGYRAKADAATYAALVQSEVLSS